MTRKQSKPKFNTKHLLESSNELYQGLLGYTPERTQLALMGAREWANFCHNTGQSREMEGIYIPRNETAIVRTEIQYPELNLFHEYYGHGIFSERTELGKKLVQLDKILLKEEKDYFNRTFPTEENVSKFRDGSKTYKRLIELKERNLRVYELFAILTEKFIDENLKIRHWEEKYKNLHQTDKEVIDDHEKFRRQYGDLSFFYGFGLGRRFNHQRLINLSRGLFNRTFEGIKVLLHFGSKKNF